MTCTLGIRFLCRIQLGRMPEIPFEIQNVLRYSSPGFLRGARGTAFSLFPPIYIAFFFFEFLTGVNLTPAGMMSHHPISKSPSSSRVQSTNTSNQHSAEITPKRVTRHKEITSNFHQINYCQPSKNNTVRIENSEKTNHPHSSQNTKSTRTQQTNLTNYEKHHRQ